MKTGAKHKFKESTQILAYLMILIFASMPIIQLVHSHEQTVEIVSSIDGKPALNTAIEQCKLCDFFVHKQIKDYHIENPTELVIPIVQPIKACTNLISVNYTFTLNGFTNKGPPVYTFS